MVIFNMTGRDIPGTISFQNQVHVNALLVEDTPRGSYFAEMKVHNLLKVACHELKGLKDSCAICVDKDSALVDILKDSLEDENFEVIYV